MARLPAPTVTPVPVAPMNCKAEAAGRVVEGGPLPRHQRHHDIALGREGAGEVEDGVADFGEAQGSVGVAQGFGQPADDVWNGQAVIGIAGHRGTAGHPRYKAWHPPAVKPLVLL